MKALVIYDGECGFCVASLQWLKRLDWFHVFDSAPYQDNTLYSRYPNLQPEACQKALHVLFPNGRTDVGGDAIREIALRLPLLMGLGLILILPPFRQAVRVVYAQVAAHRAAVSRFGSQIVQWWIPLLLTAVWVVNGLYAKLLGGVPRHEAIVARFFGTDIAPWLVKGIGLAEIAMAIWILSGWQKRLCFATQAVVILTMNTLELLFARDLLLSPWGMLFANAGLLVLAWIWSRPR